MYTLFQKSDSLSAMDALSVQDVVEDIEQEPIEDRAIIAGAQQNPKKFQTR